MQPGLVRNTPRQPHRPPEVPAQERVGLFAPGNRTATLHLDGDLAAVLVDLGGHLEQPPPPLRVLRAADRAAPPRQGRPAPVTPYALDVDAYRKQLLAARALERVTEEQNDMAPPGSLVPNDRDWAASPERVVRQPILTWDGVRSTRLRRP